jgi:hypothetical protein
MKMDVWNILLFYSMKMDVWCFGKAIEPHQNNILNHLLHKQDFMFQIIEVLKTRVSIQHIIIQHILLEWLLIAYMGNDRLTLIFKVGEFMWFHIKKVIGISNKHVVEEEPTPQEFYE